MDIPNYQALVDKYKDTDKYPRMFGTMGGLDYIIVAKRIEVNLQLGIKPLINIGKNKTSVGFRLRSAPIPTGSSVIPLLPDKTAPEFVQGYPSTGWEFPWEKVSEERASLVRMYAFERDAKDIKHLWEDLSAHRFFGKLTSFLLEVAAAEQWHITPDELKEWMQQGFFPDVHNMMAQFDPGAKLDALKAAKNQQNSALDEQIALLEGEVAAKGETEDKPYEPGELLTEDFTDQQSTAALMLGKIKPHLSAVPDAGEPSIAGAKEQTLANLKAMPEDPEFDPDTLGDGEGAPDDDTDD